jgi:hypothetical protein
MLIEKKGSGRSSTLLVTLLSTEANLGLWEKGVKLLLFTD